MSRGASHSLKCLLDITASCSDALAARDEIEDSLSLRCFDKIVMNDKIDDAYAELAEALFEL